MQGVSAPNYKMSSKIKVLYRERERGGELVLKILEGMDRDALRLRVLDEARQL